MTKNQQHIKEKTLIIGEGGAGTKIAKILNKKQKDLNIATVVASNTEVNEVKKIAKSIKIIELDIDGTGKNTQKGYMAAKRKNEEIKNLVEKNDYKHIWHIFGSGGGTGAGTALYISRSFKHLNHLFITPFPEFTEGRKILKNNLNNLENLSNYGKIWPFNNKYNRDVNYREINEKIADQIKYILSLPDFVYVGRDMDSSNVEDTIFPPAHNGQGVFSVKEYTVENFEDKMSFNNLSAKDNSFNYKLPNNLFERIGVVLEVAKNQELNDNVYEIKEKFVEEVLYNQVEGNSNHEAIYRGENKKNKITLFFSGPQLTEEALNEYAKEYKRLESLHKEKFQNTGNSSLSFGIEKEMEFNKRGNDLKEDELFDVEKKKSNKKENTDEKSEEELFDMSIDRI